MTAGAHVFTIPLHRMAANGPRWGTTVSKTPNLLPSGKNPAGTHA